MKKKEKLLEGTDSAMTFKGKKNTCFVSFTIKKNDTENCDYVRSAFNEVAERDKEHKHTLIDYLQGIVTTIFRDKKSTQPLDNAIDERMKSILDTLNAEENKDEEWAIKNGYDYAFIKYALDKLMVNGCENLSNIPTPQFIEYLKAVGVNNCCGDKTLNKYLQKVSGDFPSCRFSGVKHKEAKRRNAIINKFVEEM